MLAATRPMGREPDRFELLMMHATDAPPTGDADDSEALVDAALGGDDAAVRTALARDAGVSRRSIHVAAALADVEAMGALLAADRSLADRRGGRRGWTPLLYACCSRYRRADRDAKDARVAIAQHLIALGADVNALGREPGYTDQDQEWRPVAGAANAVASRELVRLLVFHGAAIGRATAVLTHAVRGGDPEVLRLLLAIAPSDWYQVIWALKECAVLGRTDLARMLVAHAARSWNGGATISQPALLEAIRLECDPELIDVLLGDEDTAELSRPVRRHAYRHAVRHGNRAAAELLRRRGADDAFLAPVDRLIGACISGERADLDRLLAASPRSKRALRAEDQRMLSWAIRRGHHRAVPLLLEAGLDPDVPDRDGERPLHLAVRAGSMELVDLLLRAGADVNALDFDARTPLDLARSRPEDDARERLARRLVDAGAISVGASAEGEQVDRARRFERAADAVAAGDLDILRELLDQDPALVHARSPRPHRCTLLHYCGANGTEDPRQRTPSNAPAVAELLLERGADPDATCHLYGGGATTMGLLLTSAHPRAAGVDGELVRVLARAGAALETTDLMRAIEYGAPLAVSALVGAGVPIDNLFVAAGLDRVEVMADLLARGALIDARFAEAGYGTALHAAAAMGCKRAVSFLLERGADPSLHNVWDSTPAGTARFFGHVDVAQLIARNRAP